MQLLGNVTDLFEVQKCVRDIKIMGSTKQFGRVTWLIRLERPVSAQAIRQTYDEALSKTKVGDLRFALKLSAQKFSILTNKQLE